MKTTVMNTDNEIQCPHCEGVLEVNLHFDGDVKCTICGKTFWVLPMRLYMKQRPKLVYDRDGKAVGYQLPLAYMALFPRDEESTDADPSNS